MATYTTDLTDISNADGSGTYGEFTGYDTGGTPVASETDFYIQGTGCGSAAPNRKTGLQSIGFDHGTNITIASGESVLVWHVVWASNGMDTYVGDGLGVIVGADLSNFEVWQYGGSDVSPNPYGGWKNIAVAVNDKTPDSSTGTPGAFRWFGGSADITVSIAKGNMHALDMMRYGRGEIIVTGTSALFSGMASTNDSFTNQWGLFQSIAGGYLWKGLMTLGTSTTAITMSDSNVAINIDDCPLTFASFNRIEVNNTGSSVSWTSVSISALLDAGLGTDAGLSKGEFEMIDNATLTWTGCTFTDMSTFIFLSNATLSFSTFRRCGQITQGGADIDDCTFDESSASVALVCDNLNNIDNCIFNSDGTGHAIELTSAHAGNSYTLVGTAFTGYASTDGSTGNECIYNNSGGAVTISIDGGTTPTIRNGTGATTTVISGAVTTKLTVRDLSTGAVIQSARVLVEVTDASAGFPYQDSVTITGSGTTATVTHTAHGLATNDKIIIRGANEDMYNGVYSVTVTGANTYTYTMNETISSSPATGTIQATFAFLSGLTDVNGEIEDTRVVSVDQPIKGWVRKSSSSPYYQQGAVTGTVDSSSGFNTTIQLAKDE